VNPRCPRCNSTLVAETAPCAVCLLSANPEPFAGLEIYEELGRGGMGTVYRGRHLKLQREVAVKFLAPQLAAKPEVRERFTREATALARINHPHVVRVFDAGIEEGEAFLVLEYLSGGTLAGLPAQPPERAVALGREVCEALEAVHAAGLVHRDVKPENVLLSREGVAKLSDFGIVRFTDGSQPATGTGVALGTPGYASPEVLSGKPADARSDVYAVGALLKQLVTGLPPVGESAALPAGLDAVVRKAMAQSPDERFASARAMGEALARLGTEATAALPRDEKLWVHGVALIQTASIGAALWAGLLSLTPQTTGALEELAPLVAIGAQRLADGRQYTQARFEAGWIFAAVSLLGLALAGTALLHRHWRSEGLDAPLPAPSIPAARWTLRLGTFALALYLARNLAAGNGIAPSAYTPVFGGVLLLVVWHFAALTVLEAQRRKRPLRKEPGLFFGLACALVPPVTDALRQILERMR
jgi:hypothetical protein